MAQMKGILMPQFFIERIEEPQQIESGRNQVVKMFVDT